MGVRFHCPNGHKLNVKSFLAGKRGICPHCDAKFIIPLVSGEQATAVSDDVEPLAEAQAPPTAAAMPTAIPTTPTQSTAVVAPPAAPSSPPPANSEPLAPPEVWYVRPAKGDEQYGPATTEVIQAWIAEERITPDSWVWKTGWTEWKFGSDAFAELESPPTNLPQAPVSNNTTPVVNRALRSKVKSTAKKSLRSSPRGRRQRTQKVTVMLGALVLLLGIAVVAVLSIQ